MTKIINVNKNLEVKKADVIVKARYKLNPLSLKFITTLITIIKKSDDVNEEYTFRIKDFKELTKLKRKDLYWAIKEALKELLDKPLTIQEEDGLMVCNWISGGRYIESSGEVKFMIYPKLRPYLLDAQTKFLKYRLENILTLKSSYSIRLYEILKDCFEMSKRYKNKAETLIKVSELREMLEIPKSYQYSSHIKQRILEKARKEFAEHTDIIFNYEEKKRGRKIDELIFYIAQNPKTMVTKTDKNYFKNRQTFVALLRKNYTGNEKMWGWVTFTEEGKKVNYYLGLDNKGYVYAYAPGYPNKSFDKVESAKNYDLWLKIAQYSETYQELLLKGLCILELTKKNDQRYLKLNEEIKEYLKKEEEKKENTKKLKNKLDTGFKRI